MNAREQADVKTPLVYVVDDISSFAEAVCGILRSDGYQAVAFNTGPAVLSATSEKQPDIVLLDLNLMTPEMNGIEVLRRLRERVPNLPVVMLSGEGTIQTAVEAVKLGAFDFLEKPPDFNRLKTVIRNAMDSSRLHRQVSRLRSAVEESYRMTGDSQALRTIADMVRRIAPTSASVMITGETGVGKELVAKAIHYQSYRASEPLVTLNCAAIPRDLIESELFGYARGAFTGALANRKGKFQDADNGTLFLDEIGDLSLEAQAKLLRILESSEVQPLGSNERVLIDVRLITATNKNPQAMVRNGTFREDLLHRLNTVPIHVPPLRERREDIKPLVLLFVDRYCQRHNRSLTLSAEAIQVLEGYPWPGNVRELRNIIERVVLLSETNPVEADEARSFLPAPEETAGGTLKAALETAEREAVQQALTRTSGNVTEAARILGIERPSLHRIIKRLGLPTDG